MILLPALSSVDDIFDTDLILVEHSNGEGFKMTGADLKNFINAQATDTVALNNMQSVTSNAVANCLKYLINTEVDTGKTFNGVKIYRKVVVFGFQQDVRQDITVSNEVPYITYQVADLSHSYIYNSDWGVRQPWYDTLNQIGQVYMSAGVLRWICGHPDGTAVITCEYCKQAV